MLERQVQVVAKQAPNSFAQCVEQAQHVNALMVSDSMPELNPSDIRNTLVLTLAGCGLRITATTMPTSEVTYTDISQHLLTPNTNLQNCLPE